MLPGASFGKGLRVVSWTSLKVACLSKGLILAVLPSVESNQAGHLRVLDCQSTTSLGGRLLGWARGWGRGTKGPRPFPFPLRVTWRKHFHTYSQKVKVNLMSSFYLSHIVVSHVLPKIWVIPRLEVRAVRAAFLKNNIERNCNQACKNWLKWRNLKYTCGWAPLFLLTLPWLASASLLFTASCKKLFVNKQGRLGTWVRSDIW